MTATNQHHNLPLPEISPANSAFWDGADKGRLLLLRCRECGRFRFPPTPACKACLAMESAWEPVSGKGQIWSWAVYHRAYFPGAQVPYTVAIVQLAEGPLMATNIIGSEESALRIGAKVEATFIREQGVAIPVFKMATA